MFHGIGFVCYGYDEQAAGHIVTEWFCVLFLPVWPQRSFLIPRELDYRFPLGLGVHPTPDWIQLDQLHRPHLAKGWGFTIGLFVLLFFLPYIIDFLK